MLLFFPSSPDEVAICGERLLRSVLPPVPLLQHALHDRVIVAGADVKLLSLVYFIGRLLLRGGVRVALVCGA